MSIYKKAYELLDKHANFVRGLSGVAALTVLCYGLWGDDLKERFFPAPDILTIHSYSISNAIAGGKLRISAIISKGRADCDATVSLQFTDSTGALHVMNVPQTKTPVVTRYPWVVDVPLPADMPAGWAHLSGVVSYSHPTDASCARAYEVAQSDFMIFTPQEAEDMELAPIEQENDGGTN